MEHKIKNEYKKQAIRLASMCLANNIPFEIAEYWDGFLIGYPSLGQDRVSDAVCHSGSYGREQGLLEIMGLVNTEEVGDSVEGWLTAEEVFARWNKHWLENHNKGE